MSWRNPDRSRRVTVSPVYRKHRRNPFWHFCENCKDWPAENYDEVDGSTQLPVGAFCRECLDKFISNTCSGWAASLEKPK